MRIHFPEDPDEAIIDRRLDEGKGWGLSASGRPCKQFLKVSKNRS
jgi:hypothetical protein